MDIRTPKPSEAAKIVKSFLAKNGISIQHMLALEVVARTRGFTDAHAMRAATSEDENLDLFMQNQIPADVPRPTTLLSSDNIGAMRKALARVKGFVVDEGNKVIIEQFVAYMNREMPANERPFVAFRIDVHLESDKDRVAPYATVTKLVSDGHQWLSTPVPKEFDTVMGLSLKVAIKAIRSEGVRLTEVYDMTPQPEVATASLDTAEA